MDIHEQAKQMKLESPKVAALSGTIRNQALQEVCEALLLQKEVILEANQKDMNTAREAGISDAVLHRLEFSEQKLNAVILGIKDLIRLPDPVGVIQLAREMDDGLTLYRETCPIGVIGVIFEARPDALIQISALCIKSGNCAILKGGREAFHTNKALFSIIYEAIVKAGFPTGCMMLIEARADVNTLLECHETVDLLIPRGSNAFVQYIMDHTKIPVMGHAGGICHIYVDETADLSKSIPVIVDAKVQYPAACNAVETLLVHRAIAESFLPLLAEALKQNGVTIRGSKDVQDIISCDLADDSDWDTEFLCLTLSIELVDSVDEAIAFINLHGSHHTDCILTENECEANRFMSLVDSADVFWNCSTRFSDGYRFGFGAEVGISTGKIHARGPVGLEGLVTYKYKLIGHGQTVGDYSSGKRKFHFKDL